MRNFFGHGIRFHELSFTMPQKPKINAAFLADSHQIVGGKVDATGVFDRVFIWGTPAAREFSMVVRASNLPQGATDLVVFHKSPSGKSGTGKTIIDSPHKNALSTFASRIPIHITAPGLNKLGLSFVDAPASSIHWLPFYVELLDWPVLPTGAELEAVLKDPHSIKSVRVEVSCIQCQTKYTFEIQLDPSKKRSRGTKPFPANHKFKCAHCGNTLWLADLEGQARAHLGKSMSGKAE